MVISFQVEKGKKELTLDNGKVHRVRDGGDNARDGKEKKTYFGI